MKNLFWMICAVALLVILAAWIWNQSVDITPIISDSRRVMGFIKSTQY